MRLKTNEALPNALVFSLNAFGRGEDFEEAVEELRKAHKLNRCDIPEVLLAVAVSEDAQVSEVGKIVASAQSPYYLISHADETLLVIRTLDPNNGGKEHSFH